MLGLAVEIVRAEAFAEGEEGARASRGEDCFSTGDLRVMGGNAEPLFAGAVRSAGASKLPSAGDTGAVSRFGGDASAPGGVGGRA